MTPTSWGWLILACPLAGTIVIALGWRVWPGKVPGYLGSLAILASFGCSVGAFVTMQNRPPAARHLTSTLYDYTHTVGVNVGMSILIDPLSVFMALVVSGVSFLIHVYSVAYMGSDRGYTRFFAYLNFFVFSMLLLVLAANIVLLIVGWAFVGAASYLLIARFHGLYELAPTAADITAGLAAFTLFFAATCALAVTDLKRIIAYSTMSQIGYMMLGVSTGGYDGGLFHLMTHAFFKALLFMAAGSVIAAMAGIQDINRMGGFRKAMPFTFVTFTVGALALAGFPPLSGWFSKDEILGFDVHRGGYYLVLAIVGFAGALLTAFYSFRMVFRVFYGEPVPEASSLEQGELAHGEHMNPMTGEHEDTDVGFPGPEHHIAEREFPMKLAMGSLALLAIVGGIVGIPGVTDWFKNFLEPTFADSKYINDLPSTAANWTGLIIGAGIALAGITAAFVMYLQRPGVTIALRDRFPRLHDFLSHRWYFDELYDALFVRPAFTFGRFGRYVIESAFVQGTLVGGATGIVRAGTAIARGVQSGYLRAYALLLLAGVAAVGLYFLLQST